MGKGRVWRSATGYSRGWVMPEFMLIAAYSDAFRLNFRRYFVTAGRLVPVDEDRTRLLTGWDPGQTFWSTDAVELGEAPLAWRNRERHTGSATAPVAARQFACPCRSSSIPFSTSCRDDAQHDPSNQDLLSIRSGTPHRVLTARVPAKRRGSIAVHGYAATRRGR